MKSKSNLVTVVMDGIRDTGMLMDYADTAELEGDLALHDWFRKKAEERMSRTESEWNDAKSVLKLNESKDDMAMCLKHHVDTEMTYLRSRMR